MPAKKKTTAKKTTAKKTTAKKTTAKKTTAKKTTARKTTAKKTTARKTTARKSGAVTTSNPARRAISSWSTLTRSARLPAKARFWRSSKARCASLTG